MKKVKIALDFITLYRSYKKGAFYYPKLKQENNDMKDKERVGDRLKKS